MKDTGGASSKVVFTGFFIIIIVVTRYLSVHLAAASKVPVSLATTEFRAEEASRGAADELETWALREQDENFASVHKNNPGSLGVILAGNVNEHEGVIETILSSHKYLNRALSREKGNGRTVRIDASASRDVIDAVFRGLKIRCEGMCVDEHTCELPWTVVYIRRAEKLAFTTIQTLSKMWGSHRCTSPEHKANLGCERVLFVLSTSFGESYLRSNARLLKSGAEREMREAWRGKFRTSIRVIRGTPPTLKMELTSVVERQRLERSKLFRRDKGAPQVILIWMPSLKSLDL